jgi:hypothetical protein
LYPIKILTLHNLPYARSGIGHFAADLPYFEEQVRGQIWALIYLITEEVPRECLRAYDYSFGLVIREASVNGYLASAANSSGSLRVTPANP